MTVRKVLCSIGSGPHAALLDVSAPTFRDYADRHGYELLISTTSRPERPPSWSKVSMLREASEAFDLMVWIDADAVIVDPRDDIAAELAPDRQLALVQHRHRGGLAPNAGVFVLRTGDFAKALLEQLWSARRFIHHPWWESAALVQALGYHLPGSLDPGWRGRLHRLADRVRAPRPCGPERRTPFLDGTQFLPVEWNSVYLDRAAEPRILHCPAVPVEQRLRDMRAALEAARRD